MLYSFLWDGKPDKMRRSLAKQSVVDGGIGMIDLDLFDKALKLTWIRRLLREDKRWKDIVLEKYPQIPDIKKFGNHFTHKLITNIENPFWNNVMTYFYTFDKCFKITSTQEIEASSFLFNENIKIGGFVVDDKDFINSNILYIKQLMNGDTFLNYNEVIHKYNVKTNFLTYNSIISAIKQYIRRHVSLNMHGKSITHQPPLHIIMNSKNGASNIYHAMLEADDKKKGFEKWNNCTQITLKQWKHCFKRLQLTTIDTKLRWLQFRILHQILTTNRSVSKFNKEQSHLCEFCQCHSETIHHLIWKCHKVKIFWDELKLIINKRCNHAHSFNIDENLVIFGHSERIQTDTASGVIILLAKFYIYRSKVQGTILNIRIFINELYNRYCIEKEIQKNSISFMNAWKPYLALFQSLI